MGGIGYIVVVYAAGLCRWIIESAHAIMQPAHAIMQSAHAIIESAHAIMQSDFIIIGRESAERNAQIYQSG